MSTIVDTRKANVTVGVMDKNLVTHEHLKSVTFRDVFGTLHTVFAHVDGPFRTPEDVVNAFERGILHVFDSHENAIAHWADQEGGHALVDLLKKETGDNQPDAYRNG